MYKSIYDAAKELNKNKILNEYGDSKLCHIVAGDLAAEGAFEASDFLLELGADQEIVALAAATAGHFNYCDRLREKYQIPLDIFVEGFARGGHIAEALNIASGILEHTLTYKIAYGIGLSGIDSSLEKVPNKDTYFITWAVYGAAEACHWQFLGKLLTSEKYCHYAAMGVEDSKEKITLYTLIEICTEIKDLKIRERFLEEYCSPKECKQQVKAILESSKKFHVFKTRLQLKNGSMAYSVLIHPDLLAILTWFLECNQLIPKLTTEIFLLIATQLLNLSLSDTKELYEKSTFYFYKKLFQTRFQNSFSIFSLESNKYARTLLKELDSVTDKNEVIKKLEVAQRKFTSTNSNKNSGFFSKFQKNKDTPVDILKRTVARFNRI